MRYNLRQLRKAKGLTQGELAKKTGISRATINRIETGMQEDIMVSNIIKFAEALDCKISDLVN